MAAVEVLGQAAATLEAAASRIRGSVRPAETFIENKANNTVYVVAELLDTLAGALKKLRCIAEATGAKDGGVLPLCVSWRIMSQDGGLLAVRVKPETVIRVSDGTIFFHRDNVRMQVEGTRVKLCKWNYCKEVNLQNRDEVVAQLPQIIYLLRFVANAVRKTGEAVLICAKREAPECARV